MSQNEANRTFTVVTTVEDPLTAERLVEVLVEAGIDAFSRARGSAGNDALGAATTGFGYFELMAPSEHAEAASKAAQAELESIEAEGEANAQAAEEEERSGENPTPDDAKS